MQIKKAPVKDLVSPEWNPRQITTEELEKLKTSLEEFGYIEPIIVNDVNNHVVGGNQRLRALIALGYDEVDCVYVHIEDINKEKACNVALNKISGDWDEDKLRVVLEDIELSPIDIQLTGFEELELTELEVKEPITAHEDEFNLEDEEDMEVNVKEGDLFKLGEHYLLCGDSTNEANVNRLMNGAKADLVITDPPYNVALNDEDIESLKARNRRLDGLKISNDKLSNKDFYDFLLNIFKIYSTHMKEGASIYVFYADAEILNFMKAFLEADFHFAQNCIWNKHQFVMTRKDYHYKHEPIIYGWKKGKAHNWYNDRKQSSVWDFDRPFRNEYHPTMKPISLLCYPIQNSSKAEEIVLDLFGGSGSTLIACEQLNRNCYMMELDPYYCQVIINRWEEYTGKKATKIN